MTPLNSSTRRKSSTDRVFSSSSKKNAVGEGELSGYLSRT